MTFPIAGSGGFGFTTPGEVTANIVVIEGSNGGLFVYSGTPALGNLIYSVSGADGTDSVGNAFLQGATSYLFALGIYTAVNTNGGIINWYESASAAGPWALFADIGFSWNVITGGSLLLQAANLVSLGQSGNCNWDDGNQQFNLPAAGGPFISGETFHAVSNGSNFSGTMRVKLLPWNAVWLDVQIIYSLTAAVTANFGSLPSASYYPAGSRQFALSCTQAPTAIASNNRVFMPTSGAVQVVIPQALAAANAQLSLSMIYPTN